MKQMEKVMALVLTALILLSIPLAGMAEMISQVPENSLEITAEPEGATIDNTEAQPEATPDESPSPADGIPDNPETPNPSDEEQLENTQPTSEATPIPVVTPPEKEETELNPNEAAEDIYETDQAPGVINRVFSPYNDIIPVEEGGYNPTSNLSQEELAEMSRMYGLSEADRWTEFTASPTVKTAAGGYSTYFLKEDGTVWAVGKNDYGQLGNGWTTDLSVPYKVARLKNVVDVAAGWSHALALKSDGTVWAWGRNNFLQLGVGLMDSIVSIPVQAINLPANVEQISAGQSHSMALVNGDAYCWGNNQYVQCDGYMESTYVYPHNMTSDIDTPVKKVSAGYNHSLIVMTDGTAYGWGYNADRQVTDYTNDRIARMQITGVDNIVDIAGGGYHTVAIDGNGDVWAWGRNTDGQLGLGHTNTVSTPTLVPNLSNVTQIAAGYLNTMVVRRNTSNEKEYVCSWGYGYYGQVGNNTGWASSTPVGLPAYDLPEVLENTQISIGLYHNVVTRGDGTIFVWGRNNAGQLGKNNLNLVQTTPKSFYIDNPTLQLTQAEQDELSLRNQMSEDQLWNEFKSIPTIKTIAGGYSTYFLKNDGTVWAAGKNDKGQLGIGSTNNTSVPKKILRLKNVTDVAASWDHAMALCSDGSVWAWGNNNAEKLGSGSTNTEYTYPVRTIVLPVKPEQIAVGRDHSLALINGEVFAWGASPKHQCGLGDTSKVILNNVTVDYTKKIKKISSSYQHSLALTEDGKVCGWGMNGEHQTSAAYDWESVYFLEMNELNSIVDISAGGYHSVVLDANGDIWAWGKNQDGQIGNGGSGNVTTPIKLTTISQVSQITAGYQNTMAIKSDGSLWSWGYGYYGQVGNDTNYASRVPVDISNGKTFINCSIGLYHNTAVSDKNAVYVWGRNGSGQLCNDNFLVNLQVPTLIQEEHTPQSTIQMSARSTIGNLSEGAAQYGYDLPAGVKISSKSQWSAHSGMLDSAGEMRTLYTGSAGKWIQFYPNQSGSILDYGIYDVYFWYTHNEQNEGVNLNVEIFGGNKTVQVSCAELAENAGTGADAKWVKIGTFEFAGTEDEYLKLTSTGFARVADVKFVKTGLRMDARKTEGVLSGSQQYHYELAQGVTTSGQNVWSAESGLKNSQGDLKVLYSNAPGAEIQYNPNQCGNGLEPGTYNVYIWCPKGINVNTEIKANDAVTQVYYTSLIDKYGTDPTPRWIQIGTYNFMDADDEYIKLTPLTTAWVADVKFERTDLHMDVRSTVGQRWSEAAYTYELSNGVSISSKNEWSANSSLLNSQGLNRTLYTGSAGKWVQYNPNQIGSSLEPGNYSIYYWFPYESENSGIHLEAEIYSNSETKNVSCEQLVENAGNGTEPRWVKIGTYQFAGTSDEYLKLSTTGFARIADVKFVKTDEPETTFEQLEFSAELNNNQISVSGTSSIDTAYVFFRVYDPENTLVAVDQVETGAPYEPFSLDFYFDEMLEGTYQVVAVTDAIYQDSMMVCQSVSNGQPSENDSITFLEPEQTNIVNAATYLSEPGKLTANAAFSILPRYVNDTGDNMPTVTTICALYDNNGVMVDCLTSSLSLQSLTWQDIPVVTNLPEDVTGYKLKVFNCEGDSLYFGSMVPIDRRLTVTDTGFYNGNDTNAVTLIESATMNSLNGNSRSDYVASTRKPANQDDMNTIDMGNGAQISINTLSDAEDVTTIDISAASSIVSTNGNKYEVADYANNSSIEFPQDEQDKQHLMTHIKITNESGPAANYQAQIVASNTQYTPGSTIPWSAVVQESDVIALNPGQSTEIQFSWDLTQYNNRKYVYLAISSSKASGGSPVTDSSEDRHGSTYETATNIYAPPVISGIKGRVHTSNDIDMLKFTAQNTSPHTLVNRSSSTVRMAVYSEYDLNNPFTDRIMSPGDSWTFGSTAGETYYIKIYSYEGWIGNYNFGFTDTPRVAPQEIVFSNRGNESNHYMIFDDHPEFIRRCDLIDDSPHGTTNPEFAPSALIHFDNLNPGIYTVFSYHHVGNSYSPAELRNGTAKINDTDNIYFDAVFHGNGRVKITKRGYRCMGTRVNENWDDLYMPWSDFNGGNPINEYQFDVGGGNGYQWLSDTGLLGSTTLITPQNGRAYGYSHLMMEFEVLSGSVNFSTVAYKNKAEAKLIFNSNVKSSYEDLQTVKGMAPTTQTKTSNVMNYVIDDSTSNGTLLPFSVSNQFYDNRKCAIFSTNTSPFTPNNQYATPESSLLDSVFIGKGIVRDKNNGHITQGENSPEVEWKLDSKHPRFVNPYPLSADMKFGEYSNKEYFMPREEISSQWMRELVTRPKEERERVFKEFDGLDKDALKKGQGIVLLNTSYGITYETNLRIYNAGSVARNVDYLFQAHDFDVYWRANNSNAAKWSDVWASPYITGNQHTNNTTQSIFDCNTHSGSLTVQPGQWLNLQVSTTMYTGSWATAHHGIIIDATAAQKSESLFNATKTEFYPQN